MGPGFAGMVMWTWNKRPGGVGSVDADRNGPLPSNGAQINDAASAVRIRMYSACLKPGTVFNAALTRRPGEANGAGLCNGFCGGPVARIPHAAGL